MAGETRAQNLNNDYREIHSEKYKTNHKAENSQKPRNGQPTECFTSARVICRARRRRKNNCERRSKTDEQ